MVANRETQFDAIVIGAGIAGAIAATLLARRGWHVALIEKSSWPRAKVCGGCLNAKAVSSLHALGLGETLSEARPIHRAIWHAGGRRASISVGGAAISRSDLDSALVQKAVDAGCEFLPGTSATVLPENPSETFRRVQIPGTILKASMILACDGIGGTSLANESWAKWNIAEAGFIGASASGAEIDVETNAIEMHIGHGGYVGLVRMQDDQVHLAAALDPAICKSRGGPGNFVAEILGARSNLQSLKFHGIGPLLRRRKILGGHRVLAIGDACGYVEPFTGEGMAWAIESARAAANLLPRGTWPTDLPEIWRRQHAKIVGKEQRWCRLLRPMMHHPLLAAGAIRLAVAAPGLGRFVSRRFGERELDHDTSVHDRNSFREEADHAGHRGDRDGIAAEPEAGANS